MISPNLYIICDNIGRRVREEWIPLVCVKIPVQVVSRYMLSGRQPLLRPKLRNCGDSTEAPRARPWTCGLSGSAVRGETRPLLLLNNWAPAVAAAGANTTATLVPPPVPLIRIICSRGAAITIALPLLWCGTGSMHNCVCLQRFRCVVCGTGCTGTAAEVVLP